MDFSQLPEELIAKIVLNLDFEDVWKFMATSPRNCRIVQTFKLNKRRLYILQYALRDDIFKWEAVTENPRQYYIDTNSEPVEENLELILELLKRISCIEKFSLFQIDVSSSFICEVNMCGTTFRRLVISRSSIHVNVDEFLSFCKKFKKIQFFDVMLLQDNICDDVSSLGVRDFRADSFRAKCFRVYVLLEILSYTEFHLSDCCYLIAGNQVTDRTLFSLIGPNSVQEICVLRNIYNSFTIAGIIQVIKLARELQSEDLNWDLGILSAKQEEAARLHFEDPSSEISLLYDVTIERRSDCTVYVLLDGGSMINFAVAKPKCRDMQYSLETNFAPPSVLSQDLDDMDLAIPTTSELQRRRKQVHRRSSW